VVWRIENRAELTRRAIGDTVARLPSRIAAAIAGAAVRHRPTRAAGMLFAEERSGLAGPGAGSVGKAAIAVRTWTDTAAPI
jgi:hypothetical protein